MDLNLNLKLRYILYINKVVEHLTAIIHVGFLQKHFKVGCRHLRVVRLDYNKDLYFHYNVL